MFLCLHFGFRFCLHFSLSMFHTHKNCCDHYFLSRFFVFTKKVKQSILLCFLSCLFSSNCDVYVQYYLSFFVSFTSPKSDKKNTHTYAQTYALRWWDPSCRAKSQQNARPLVLVPQHSQSLLQALPLRLARFNPLRCTSTRKRFSLQN